MPGEAAADDLRLAAGAKRHPGLEPEPRQPRHHLGALHQELVERLVEPVELAAQPLERPFARLGRSVVVFGWHGDLHRASSESRPWIAEGGIAAYTPRPCPNPAGALMQAP